MSSKANGGNSFGQGAEYAATEELSLWPPRKTIPIYQWAQIPLIPKQRRFMIDFRSQMTLQDSGVRLSPIGLSIIF